MKLPPRFLDELRNRTSIVQVIGRKVAWDTRKSNPAKGDMWSQCPFHLEKTASFHVDDQKGFFHCFGCHEKGNVFSFLQKTENIGFMGAVERLAHEAGMQMPALDPQAQEKMNRRDQLIDVMEQAVQFFRLRLNTNAGSAARDYLTGRGLSQQTIERFEIGFAPAGWQNLFDHLQGKSISPDLMLACGLVKPPKSGKNPYDTFRNRIMFPIKDARGQTIAFGGRTLDPDEDAKYLNSPETELFDKGRSLYHFAPARAAVGKGQPLIVVEGYMDVIALASNGFEGAVAPLGTAITEAQLQLLWRVSKEPIIALDGDTAGIKAAYRLIDMALPLLGADRAMRFALMPSGQDPDDYIRANGASGFRECLKSAQSTVRLLWERETAGKAFDTPERRAGLDVAINGITSQISDKTLKYHFQNELRQLQRALISEGFRGAARGYSKKPRTPMAQAETKSSALAQGTNGTNQMAEAAILLAILKTPQILPDVEEALEKFHCNNPKFESLRRFLHLFSGNSEYLMQEAQQAHQDAVASLCSMKPLATIPFIKKAVDTEYVTKSVLAEIEKITVMNAHKCEMDEIIQDIESDYDEKTQTRMGWRLQHSTKSLAQIMKPLQVDQTEYTQSDNGAKISTKEQKELDELVKKIKFNKTKH